MGFCLLSVLEECPGSGERGGENLYGSGVAQAWAIPDILQGNWKELARRRAAKGFSLYSTSTVDQPLIPERKI